MTKHQNKREMNLRKERTKLSKSLYVKRGIYVLSGRVEIAGGEKRQNNVTIMMIKNLVKISIIKKEEQVEKKFYKKCQPTFHL